MYNTNETEASKSALLELGIALRQYKDDMVLAGGWAPYFISNKFFPHCGSIDIDFVLKTKIMKKYETICKSVLTLGYQKENEFKFSKKVTSPVDNLDYAIHLDFLCDKEGLRYAHIRNIQDDLQAFAFEGSNIAFDFNFEQEVNTVLPKNGNAETTIKVADLIASLILKGQAIDGRAKQKDYYDIYSLTFFNGSPKNAADYFNSKIKSKLLTQDKLKLMKHSLAVIRKRFQDENSIGLYQIEAFTDGAVKPLQAYTQVASFLKEIKE